MKSFNNYGPAICALQQECEYKLQRARMVYLDDGRGPAQRYIKDGRVRYRPWSGPIGGPWIKGKSPSADTSEPR